MAVYLKIDYMTIRCILCSRFETSKEEVETHTVYSLEKKLVGIDYPFALRGVHRDCLTHFLTHVPRKEEPVIVHFLVENKPVWFLTKPQRFYVASGCTREGSFQFSFDWLREVFKITPTPKTDIPARVRKELPQHCEVCGEKSELKVHHKIPLSLGGTNCKENLQVLCKRCYPKAGFNLPPVVNFDFTYLLKQIHEKESNTEISCFTFKEKSKGSR